MLLVRRLAWMVAHLLEVLVDLIKFFRLSGVEKRLSDEKY
jgi:hypothetical protein